MPRTHSGERTVSATNDARKLKLNLQENELGPCLTPRTQVNSKSIKDLKQKTQIVKLLEESTGGKVHNTGFGNDFMDMMPKAQNNRNKKQLSGTTSN